MAKIANITGPFTSLPLPESNMRSVTELHRAILNAPTESDVIKAFMKQGSANGWFSNAPRELWDKLNDMTKKKH